MNAHQEKILDEINSQLGEHFDSFVVIVSAEKEDCHVEQFRWFRRGGSAQAMGLMDLYKHFILTNPGEGLKVEEKE